MSTVITRIAENLEEEERLLKGTEKLKSQCLDISILRFPRLPKAGVPAVTFPVHRATTPGCHLWGQELLLAHLGHLMHFVTSPSWGLSSWMLSWVQKKWRNLRKVVWVFRENLPGGGETGKGVAWRKLFHEGFGDPEQIQGKFPPVLSLSSLCEHG